MSIEERAWAGEGHRSVSRNSLNRNCRIDTKAVHAGAHPVQSVTHPHVHPIYASAVFSFESLSQLDEVWEGKTPGYVYSRMKNPNVECLEKAVAELEGAGEAIAFSSGMAAITLSLLAGLESGDHVVAARVLYGATRSILVNDFPKRGIQCTFVNILDLDEVRAAMKPETRIILCETVSNPLMEVADLEALADIAHRGGAMLYVDNTFASPVLCRPIDYGADVVLYSATKYLNGHDDVTMGVAAAAPGLCGGQRGSGVSGSIAEKLRYLCVNYGATPSPFDAWLLMRGLRTLALRVNRQSENAFRLSLFLKGHPKVSRVYYPGLEDSPHYLQARKYLGGHFGGMLSFEVASGLSGATRVIEHLEMVKFAPSLGGVATTVSHPGKTSHRSLSEDERRQAGISDGLIRVSVGIEDFKDIRADFEQALQHA